ncbi:response regulator [Pseudomonas aeruginosa]|nr:response regulator [Pseudomonas aeruginosa]MCO3724049.1 response regulator [Pseudomonas aeruginosa]
MSGKRMANVLILNPHPIARLGMETMLQECGHQVIGVASNGVDALGLAKELSPDLLITDIDTPRLGGLEVMRRLQARKSGIRMLVYTSMPADVYEHLCIAAGASGYVSASDAVSVLADAVSKVLADRSYFRTKAVHGESDALEAPREQLSAREITVLHYLADGYRVKQIAGEMSISDRTVSTYKTRLLEKTGASSLVELLRLAGQRGLLERKEIGTAPEDDASNLDLKFNALLDAIPHPICLRSPDCRIQSMNEAYSKLLGIPQHKVRKALQRELGVIDEEHLAYYRATFDAAVANKAPYMMVVTLYLNGQRKVLRHSGCPVLDASGALVGMLCSSIDLEEEDMIIQSLRDELTSLRTVRRRRGAYLLEQQSLLKHEASTALKTVKKLGAEPLQEIVNPLLESIIESVTLVGEMTQLEDDRVVFSPLPQNLNSLTMGMLARISGGALPSYQFISSGGDPMAWVDADHYSALLKAVMLHLSKVKADDVKITSQFFEPHPSSLQWRLRFTASLPLSEDTAPMIYLALASEICRRFNGSFKVEASDADLFVGHASMTFSTTSATH